jgi:hypothetical protein
MNRARIIEIIESYRPGEGLETDPEVREALELAARDPELSELQQAARLFDEAFGEMVRDIDVPESLHGDILRAAAAVRAGKPEAAAWPGNVIVKWFHPAAFAAAAIIVLFLALSFTFWNRPGTRASDTQLAGANPLMETAQVLYQNLNPSFRSRDGNEIREYLRNRNGLMPVSLPAGFAWDRSFACDVLDVDGKKVSLVCFSSPDGTNKLHLFTFYRRDFPQTEVPLIPEIRKSEDCCSATWGQDDMIHVLYSDNGNEEKLREVLDI